MEPAEIVLAMWRDIDLNGGCRVHEWYVPDGTLTFDRHIIHGRDAIAATYLKRRSGTGRVARHVAANVAAEAVDNQTVRVYSIVVLFAGNGTPPLPAVTPQLVGDVEDLFVRVDGQWLIKSRRISHVFMAEDTVLGVPTR
jgi:SnoaL-like domain